MEMTKLFKISLLFVSVTFCGSLLAGSSVELVDRSDQKTWSVLIDNKEVLVYNYGEDVDLPHYWPLNSPSGKNMLIQKTNPYPHHRAFWFGDTVQTKETGRKVSFYNALYSGVLKPGDDRKNTAAPYKDHVRHTKLKTRKVSDSLAVVEKWLVWEYDHNKPVLDEHRNIRIKALGDGEYLLDITFTLTAAYGDVDFVSDSVHYAWPYLRINPVFSGDKGGIITSDSGAKGQKATDGKTALWIDYSNTVEGVTEGLAVFQWPDGKKHRWLTREYGTFGPRREDSRSGKPFTVRKGESIKQRVGILVHKGDVKTGQVSQRYKEYVAGKL